MDQKKILDSILRSLADHFEAGKGHWQPIEPESAEEYEPLRECMANLLAEGSVIQATPGAKVYQLTARGYSIYKARIAALRVLG
jgi:hypothetical protein